MNVAMPPRVRALNRPAFLPKLIFALQFVGGVITLGVVLFLIYIGLCVLTAPGAWL